MDPVPHTRPPHCGSSPPFWSRAQTGAAAKSGPLNGRTGSVFVQMFGRIGRADLTVGLASCQDCSGHGAEHRLPPLLQAVVGNEKEGQASRTPFCF